MILIYHLLTHTNKYKIICGSTFLVFMKLKHAANPSRTPSRANSPANFAAFWTCTEFPCKSGPVCRPSDFMSGGLFCFTAD